MVSIALIISFANQQGKQGLGVVQGSRQIGQPASAVSGLRNGVTGHEALLRRFRRLARVDKIHIGGFSD